MKKNILLSAAAALLVASTSLYATSNKELKAIEHADVPVHHFWAFGEAPDHLTKQQVEYLKSVGLLKKHAMLSKEMKKLVHKQNEASKEVTAGLVETLKAIANLEKKETKAAEKHLKIASEFFEKAIKKEPALKLIPVDEDISLVEHTITLDDAKKIKKTALKLLQENHPQETIDLLSLLKNQITVSTTAIPMDLYPAATQKAYEELKKGKKPEVALQTLAAALDTIVTVEVVVPIPVLVAQSAILDASKLSKNKGKEAQKLLDIAQNQLDLAQYEGYLSKYDKEYKALSEEINVLKKKAGEGNIVEKDYDKIKSYFDGLLTKMHKGKKKEK